jgi:prenyltransferase beta subunit
MAKNLYHDEITASVKWLFGIQEKGNFGWSWIKHISPNIQNTAEVIFALSKHPWALDKNEKEFLKQSVEYWLLNADLYASLSRDWIWTLMALDEYTGCEVFDANAFDMEKVEKKRQMIITKVLEFQNDDGGWADNLGEISAISRTGLAIFALSRYYETNAEFKRAIDNAIHFLLGVQNEDGGFGNIKKGDLHKESQKKLLKLAHDDVEAQYLSSSACTSYCIIGLNSISPHKYAKQIKDASDYLIREQHSDGNWDIFYEVGMKKDDIFTFRHFGTAWTLKALFDNRSIDKNSLFLLKGLQYLIRLQDNVCGGWKSSPDSDTYTWSTCNALCVLADHKEFCENVNTELFYRILNGENKINEEKIVKESRLYKIFSVALYCVTICLLYALIGVLCFIGTDISGTLFKVFLTTGYVALLVPLDIFLYKRYTNSKINGLLILLHINLVGFLIINFLW